MPYRSLNEFIQALEKEKELVRIKNFVDPKLEMTELNDRIVKNDGPALLFENNGTDFPVLLNAFGSDKRLAMAFGVDNIDEVPEGFNELFDDLMGAGELGLLGKLKMLPKLGKIASWMPEKLSGKGACQEVVMDDPDLSKLPVLTCWPADGGPFITFPLVHTVHPETDVPNVGMYRLQVMSKDSTGMHWHLHKDGAEHYRRSKEKGIKRMPVAVAIGGDPLYTYSATAPLPEMIDEYIFTGMLRKKKVKLVKCLTNDIYVPEDVDFVIEGYVDTDEDLVYEGPFGDHTGFYSLADYYPKFHVTAITHKKDAVYPATIVGIPPQEDFWLGKATERIFLFPIKLAVVPELQDMFMPAEGVAHNLVIGSIKHNFRGQAQKVASALWGAGQMMFNKVLVVTDENTDVQNKEQILETLSANVDPVKDIFFANGPMDILDHASDEFAFGSKMCIDACNDRNLDAPKVLDDQLKSEISKIGVIKEVSTTLIDKGISVLLAAVKKTAKEDIADTHNALHKKLAGHNIRFVIYLEEGVPLDAMSDILWFSTGNIDPERDCYIAKDDNGAIMGIDATGKSEKTDGFKRDWPNLVCMDMVTIEKVDQKWDTYDLGPFIPSPSRRYLHLMKGMGAVAETE